MTTAYTPASRQFAPDTPIRRNWLKRLGALLGGTLLAGPALAHAARRGPTQVQGSPIFLGEIMLCAFNYAPKGFAMCNGQLLPINQNQALFALLGTAYGGNGITTFALPDLRGRVLRGMGAAYNVGATGGSETVGLTANNLPGHTHTANANSAVGTTSSPVGNVPAAVASTNLNGEAVAVLAYGPAQAAGTSTTTSTGVSAPITDVAPFLGLNYCIALTGIFPPRQ